MDPSGLRGTRASDGRADSECCDLKMGSGENSRNGLMLHVVDTNDIVEPKRVDDVLDSDVVSAQSSDGCRRISSSVGAGDVIVATAESLVVDDDV